MKSWTYGINTYYRTAHYEIERGPWWAFFIRWLADCLCDFAPAIPFPPIPIHDEEGNRTTLREEWGDTFQWIHVALHMPIFERVERKIQRIWIPASYDEIKQRHYAEDKEFFDEAEKLWEGEETAS